MLVVNDVQAYIIKDLLPALGDIVTDTKTQDMVALTLSKFSTLLLNRPEPKAAERVTAVCSPSTRLFAENVDDTGMLSNVERDYRRGKMAPDTRVCPLTVRKCSALETVSVSKWISFAFL